MQEAKRQKPASKQKSKSFQSPFFNFALTLGLAQKTFEASRSVKSLAASASWSSWPSSSRKLNQSSYMDVMVLNAMDGPPEADFKLIRQTLFSPVKRKCNNDWQVSCRVAIIKPCIT